MSLLVVDHNSGHGASAAATTPNKASWTLYGHTGEVLGAAAHKNLFTTCCAEGSVLLWRLTAHDQRPENVCGIATGGPAVLETCFVSDRTIATAQGDASVGIWDMEAGKRLSSVSRVKVAGRSNWPVVNTVTMVAEQTLCFGSDDGYLCFVDCRSPSITTSMNHKAPVTSLRAVEGCLFAGDACGHVCGFDQRMSGRKFVDLKCSTDAIGGVACGSKGGRVVGYSMDGKASLVDTQPFAVSEQDRLLSVLSLGDDSVGDWQPRRIDWSDALDALAFPVADGAVAFASPTRLSTGVVRTMRCSASGAGDEGEQAYFATFFMDRYVVLGGNSSLSLQEW